MNSPSRMPGPDPQPERKGHWLATLAKVFLWFCAITVVLSVLVFGTCLLLFSRH